MGIKMQGTSGAIVPKSLECAFLSLAIHSVSQVSTRRKWDSTRMREECAAPKPNTNCSGTNWTPAEHSFNCAPRRPNGHFSIAIAMAIGLGLECCHE